MNLFIHNIFIGFLIIVIILQSIYIQCTCEISLFENYYGQPIVLYSTHTNSNLYYFVFSSFGLNDRICWVYEIGTCPGNIFRAFLLCFFGFGLAEVFWALDFFDFGLGVESSTFFIVFKLVPSIFIELKYISLRHKAQQFKISNKKYECLF